jgi:hypothetical protein
MSQIQRQSQKNRRMDQIIDCWEWEIKIKQEKETKQIKETIKKCVIPFIQNVENEMKHIVIQYCQKLVTAGGGILTEL